MVKSFSRSGQTTLEPHEMSRATLAQFRSHFNHNCLLHLSDPARDSKP